ncbi:hypothetical protein [Lacticaseibacillus absianus]|uniref:hypothetical protein n=1 Tax=Lacticaseibacillus absianus TaxID=2729623 RepID=UPI0015CA90B1|nr:hypothetical protein [Lacticaseibacillus absianus]
MTTSIDTTFEQLWVNFAQQPYYRELASAGAAAPLAVTGTLLGQLMIPITWLPMRAWTTPMVQRGLASLKLALAGQDRATALIVLDTVAELIVYAVDLGVLAVDASVLVLQLDDYWVDFAAR